MTVCSSSSEPIRDGMNATACVEIAAGAAFFAGVTTQRQTAHFRMPAAVRGGTDSFVKFPSSSSTNLNWLPRKSSKRNSN